LSHNLYFIKMVGKIETKRLNRKKKNFLSLRT